MAGFFLDSPCISVLVTVRNFLCEDPDPEVAEPRGADYGDTA